MGHSFLGNSWTGEKEGCELAPTELEGRSCGSLWFLFHMVEIQKRDATSLLMYHEIGVESLGDKKDSSEGTFPHLYI